MANWMQFTMVPARSYVGPTSRYINSRVIHYTEDKKTTFETYKRTPRNINGNEEWLQITKDIEYRPDLVSQEVYGTPDMWWSIMEFNGMKDILEFHAGVNIRLPANILP